MRIKKISYVMTSPYQLKLSARFSNNYIYGRAQPPSPWVRAWALEKFYQITRTRMQVRDVLSFLLNLAVRGRLHRELQLQK